MSSIYCPPLWTIRPQDGGNFATLCGDTFRVYENRDPRPDGLAAPPFAVPLEDASHDMVSLVRLALEHRADNVWLLPRSGARESAGDVPLLQQWPRGALTPDLRRRAPEFLWGELTARAGRNAAARSGGLRVQRRGPDGHGHGPILRIYAAWCFEDWRFGFADLPADPEQRSRIAVSALLLAQYALQNQLWFTPSYTGIKLLRSILSQMKVPTDITDITPEFHSWMLDPEHHIHPIMWGRPLEPDEAAAGAPVHLYKYDRNASYVSSARAVPCGMPQPTAAREFYRGQPGVYRLSAQAPAEWPEHLPGPFRVDNGEGAGAYPLHVRSTWAWEPQIRIALAHGWAVDFLEGFTWPRSQQHRLFDPFLERIWDARRQLAELERHECALSRQAAAIAGRFVKQIGVSTIGRLKQTEGRSIRATEEAEALGLEVQWIETGDYDVTGAVEVRDEVRRTDLVRPEWYSTIIANAIERLQNAAYNYAPTDTLALFVDALYTLKPHEELSGDRLKVGGFRACGAVEVEGAALQRPSAYAVTRAWSKAAGSELGDE